MTVALKFAQDVKGLNSYAPTPSDIVYSANLQLNQETNITLPGTDEIYCVSFRYQPGSAVYVDTTGATAAIPSGGTLTQSTAELNPASLRLVAGNKISMITNYDTSFVSVVVWRVQ